MPIPLSNIFGTGGGGSTPLPPLSLAPASGASQTPTLSSGSATNINFGAGYIDNPLTQTTTPSTSQTTSASAAQANAPGSNAGSDSAVSQIHIPAEYIIIGGGVLAVGLAILLLLRK